MYRYQRSMLLSSVVLFMAVLLPTVCFSQHKVIPYNDYSEDKVGPSVWNESNISRANALGGCGINLVDEHSGFYNPGALGLFHLNKTLAFSFPNGTEYLPDINDNARRNTISISGGISYRLLKPSRSSNFNISIAFAYIHDKWESGWVKTYDYVGNEVDFEYNEFNNHYSMAVAIESFVRFGAGYMITSPTIEYGIRYEPIIQNNYSDRHGFGFILEKTFTLQSGSGINDSHINLIPSIAFTRNDDNDGYAKIRVNKLGFSLNLIYGLANHNQLSLRTLLEYDKPDNYERFYTDYFGTMVYTVEYEWRHKLGVEIGVYDILALRLGKLEGLDDMTFGAGLSVRGLIQYFINQGAITDKEDLWHSILKNLDISFDYARVKGPFAKSVNFMKLSLSF